MKRAVAALLLAAALAAPLRSAQAYVGSGSGGGQLLADFFIYGSCVTLGIGSLVTGGHNASEASRGINTSDDWLAGGYAVSSLTILYGGLALAYELKTRGSLLGVALGALTLGLGSFALGANIWSNKQGPVVRGKTDGRALRVFQLPALRF